MNVDIVSWRSIIGCFGSVKTICKVKNKFKLLSLVFNHFMMCLFHFLNCIINALVRYICFAIYSTCLLIWCSYFCIAVRLYYIFFNFTKEHPLMFLCLHQWWTFALILRDSPIQVRLEICLNLCIGT